MEHMEQAQLMISNIFKEPVLYFYNPTAQSHNEDMIGWFGDLTQAGTQKLGRITDEVNSLVQHLRQTLADVGKHGCLVHIAHSQGALITSLACKLLKPEEMRRMEIICFGGAAAIRKTPQTPFRRCINYYAVNDPLLWVAPSAAQSLRSGRVVGDADEEFCFLAPRIGDPIADHDITGPTYLQALQWEGERFYREHRSIGYKIFYPLLHALLTLLRMIHEKFNEMLKSALRSMIQSLVSANNKVQSNAARARSLVRNWIVRPLTFLVMVLVEMVRIWRGQEKYELVISKDNEPNSPEADLIPVIQKS